MFVYAVQMLRPSLDEACVKRLGVLAHKSGQKGIEERIGVCERSSSSANCATVVTVDHLTKVKS